MFEVGDKVEFKDPQARKWVPGVIVDEDNGFYEVEKPSGKVKKGIPEAMVRRIEGVSLIRDAKWTPEEHAAMAKKAPAKAKKLTDQQRNNMVMPPAKKQKTPAEKQKALAQNYGEGSRAFKDMADAVKPKGKTASLTVIDDIAPKDPASVEFHRDLQKVYDLFNKELFAGELPGCFWTTIQKRSVLAHFKANAWVQGNRGNGVCDEIMINPDYLPIIGLEDFISSILHEQVHQWQHRLGTISRHGYHNEEFAEMMLHCGLQTSHTAKEGGKKVGQQMDHYIVKGGKFDVLVKALIRSGFGLSWVGAVAELHGTGAEWVPGLKSGKTSDVGTKPIKKKATRAKFTCPADGCKETAMAKPSAKLVCGEHMKEMVSNDA